MDTLNVRAGKSNEAQERRARLEACKELAVKRYRDHAAFARANFPSARQESEEETDLALQDIRNMVNAYAELSTDIRYLQTVVQSRAADLLKFDQEMAVMFKNLEAKRKGRVPRSLQSSLEAKYFSARDHLVNPLKEVRGALEKSGLALEKVCEVLRRYGVPLEELKALLEPGEAPVQAGGQEQEGEVIRG